MLLHSKFQKLVRSRQWPRLTLTIVQSTVKCSVCLSHMHVSSLKINDFIESKCVPTERPSSHQNVAINAPIRVGRLVTHSTRTMYSYRGLRYCSLCGYMVHRIMRSLAQPCKGTSGRTKHGQSVLDAIAAHKLPPNVSSWPDT